MGLSKLTIDVADFGAGRAASERIELSEAGEPLAVSMFEIPGTRGWRIEAYYEAAPDFALVREALGHDLRDATVLVEEVPDENWVAISQAALPPVSAGRFLVHGSHDRGVVGRRLNAIEIDAGEAFGTAHHATTQGCLTALDLLTRSRSFGNVLDLGCGSGVLAIAAGRALPHAHILASDIDREAVRVARSNVQLNRLGGRVKAVTAIGLAHGAVRRAAPFDLLLANILAGPLIALAPGLANAVAPSGVAVLSGILAEQSAEVEAAYRAAGFTVAAKRTANGWATLVLVRRPSRPKTPSLRRAKRAA